MSTNLRAIQLHVWLSEQEWKWIDEQRDSCASATGEWVTRSEFISVMVKLFIETDQAVKRRAEVTA